MQADKFIQNSKPFIEWMLGWKDGLQSASLAEIINGQPEKVGIVCVDVIKGFCSVGPLSSPRVNNIVAPITKIFQNAWDQGIRDFALPHDSHPENSIEFNQYGTHCVYGTEEAEVVDEFKALPFFEHMTIIDKNSINAGLNAHFLAWIDERIRIHTWIVLGDCTDICTYQLALHLRVGANEWQKAETRVIVPVTAVDTYDLPVGTAQELGIIPHDGDFLHLVFLYHMMLNGVEIYSELTE
jgi:nicotinamidase-related amidase